MFIQIKIIDIFAKTTALSFDVIYKKNIILLTSLHLA